MASREFLPADRWARVEKLFFAAAELPPRKRRSFVTEECGADRQMLDDVLSLLDYDTREEAGSGDSLIDALHAGARSVIDRDTCAEGSFVGPYRIGRELGRGGMSVVYLGSRADGEFRKNVAIKLIKRGMDTDTVIQRLRRERRILAALDHPYIARLLDGGTTADGLPWIAMEFVEGVPITRYCEEHRLGVEERCQLIGRICEAAGYAHRNLVVHRDLKPANILVAADGNPKLLDFGIAGLLAAETDLSVEPALTRGFARPLTPEYASPEQAGGAAVGTTTDIYSLGVVLYELLVGSRPASSQERASVAAERAGKSARWVRRLRGDLDNILQMALRAEPERRYLSMVQFALDLRRHLEGMPVAARQETLFYRTGKFLTRHRFASALTAALVIVGAGGAGLYLHQARIAARRFDDLRHFANSFLFDVDDKLRNLPNATGARAVVAQKALGYLNALAAEKSGDRQLQREAGNAWRRVGELQGDPGHSSLGDSAGARSSYEKSIMILQPLALAETGPRHHADTRSDLVDTYTDLALLERIAGNTARAEELLLKALPLARDVGSPPDPKLQADLGVALVQYSWVLEVRGQSPASAVQARQAVDLLEAASRSDPAHRTDLADALSVLGGSELRLGQTADSLVYYRRNLVIREELTAAQPNDRAALRSLMLAWGHVGDTLTSTITPALNKPAEAVDAYDRVLEIARQLVRTDQTDLTARMDLAISLEHSGDALAAANKASLAIERYRESLGMLSELQVSDGNNRRAKEYFADVKGQMGPVLLKVGLRAEGREALDQAIDAGLAVQAQDPGSAANWFLMLRWAENLGESWAQSGDREPLIALLRRMEPAAETARTAAKTESRRALVADFWQRYGKMFDRLNDPAEARPCYERSLQLWTAMQPLSKQYAARPEEVRQRLALYRAQ